MSHRPSSSNNNSNSRSVNNEKKDRKTDRDRNKQTEQTHNVTRLVEVIAVNQNLPPPAILPADRSAKVKHYPSLVRLLSLLSRG